MNDSPRSRGTQLVRGGNSSVSRAPTASRRKPLYADKGGSGRGRGEEKETKGGTALNNVPLGILFAFYEAQFRFARKQVYGITVSFFANGTTKKKKKYTERERGRESLTDGFPNRLSDN